MALVVLGFFLGALRVLASLASAALFKGAAVHLVLLIHALKLPGALIDSGLELLKTLIAATGRHLLQGLGTGLACAAAHGANFTVAAGKELVAWAAPVAGGLVETVPHVVEDGLKTVADIVPQLIGEVAKTAAEIAVDSASNFAQAVRFVAGNA